MAKSKKSEETAKPASAAKKAAAPKEKAPAKKAETPVAAAPAVAKKVAKSGKSTVGAAPFREDTRHHLAARRPTELQIARGIERAKPVRIDRK